MRWYTKDHLWVDVDGSGVAIGITSRGNDAMGGITFVDVGKDTVIVESTKNSIEIKSPVTFGRTPCNRSHEWAEDAVLASAGSGFTVDFSRLLTAEDYSRLD